MDRFWPNLHKYVIGRRKNADEILVTLTSFSRSQEGLECWKMGHSLLSALYLLMNGQILAKLIQIYHWEGEKAD